MSSLCIIVAELEFGLTPFCVARPSRTPRERVPVPKKVIRIVTLLGWVGEGQRSEIFPVSGFVV